MPEEVQNESQSIAQVVREKFDLLRSGNHFAILGVNRTADIETVRNAYFALAKLVHPDVIARQGLKELEREAVEVFKAISEAYSILSDARRRAEFERQFEAPSPAEPVITPRGTHMVTPGGTRVTARIPKDKNAEARIHFHKGTLLLQRRSYGEAEDCFRRAAELDSSQTRYLTSLGMAVMQNEAYPLDRRLEEAKKLFEQALQMSGSECEPYYFMSLYYKTVGDESRQRQCLQDGLAINPRHIESLREARLLALRIRKRSSGLFGQIQDLFSRFSKKR